MTTIKQCLPLYRKGAWQAAHSLQPVPCSAARAADTAAARRAHPRVRSGNDVLSL